ncbi:MAG: hypothetical protein OEU68_12570 [Nitrospira sp.]|nr:hypothetical protein [Nitrospira sp.]MDH4245238.1 hypothetical protein [Nitrospira sp.]MDH4357113.1 hypothetical protein [Nitrospira sp.]MDH5318159.1 hypothetical protein [Nitrospira sp.]
MTTRRSGNFKTTIWQNVGEKGPFFATTFSRPFKDQSGASHWEMHRRMGEYQPPIRRNA